MARPRKPTKTLKLHGGLRKDRHSSRSDEPKPTGKVVKPKGMSKDATAHWDQVVPGLLNTGVATSADVSALVRMCEWWAEGEKCRRSKSWKPMARVQAFAVAHKQWRDLASRFGLTPSDRANLTVKDKDKHDPAADFIA